MREMEDPDAIGEAHDPILNDLIYVYVKIKNNKILDISFQTYGCALALASSSMLTELIKGTTIQKAMKTAPEDIADALGDFAKQNMHSCNLAINGLRAALKNYMEKKE